MSGRMRKHSESLAQKIGPIRATLPMTSVLRGALHGNISCNYLPVLSPPIRHVSPDHSIIGHRSPGIGCLKESGMRRTASLDTLYVPPSWSFGMVSTILHLDKATQTDDSTTFENAESVADTVRMGLPSPEIKIEKVIRQRWQRVQRSGENSISCQTLTPIHVKGSPVMIPQRTNTQMHIRPMRSSVEGLNQEIEKLVLFTGQAHSCRNESGLFSRATPEGHRAPLAELFHNDTRSVNTQTPIGDIGSSDESHSTSPDDGNSARNASPRINRFLAREPPDGCEKVFLKPTETDQGSTTLFKPCVGFQLRPSLGSAFKPLQPISSLNESKSDSDNQTDEQQQ